jgi:tyrosine-protein phosphatase SIW14
LVFSALTFSFNTRVAAIFVLTVSLGIFVPQNFAAQEASQPATAPDPRSVLTFGERLKVHGIPNAGKVSDTLYRGGQPRTAGYQQLKDLGVSIVVDLRNTGPRSPEKILVESLGMRYVSIPTSAYLGPSDNQVTQFLQLRRDTSQQKMFVHCYFGDDRTGVMIAAYRMAEQHWTANQAYNEMRFFHFHTYLILMGHYVKAFPLNFAISPAFSAIRAPNPAS